MIQYEIVRSENPCCWLVSSRSGNEGPKEMYIDSDDAMLEFIRGVLGQGNARISIASLQTPEEHYPLRAIA